MEPDQLYKSISVANQVADEALGQEGLSSVRRNKDDSLAFAFDGLKPTNQVRLLYSRILGKFVERKSLTTYSLLLIYKLRLSRMFLYSESFVTAI